MSLSKFVSIMSLSLPLSSFAFGANVGTVKAIECEYYSDRTENRCVVYLNEKTECDKYSVTYKAGSTSMVIELLKTAMIHEMNVQFNQCAARQGDVIVWPKKKVQNGTNTTPNQ